MMVGILIALFLCSSFMIWVNWPICGPFGITDRHFAVELKKTEIRSASLFIWAASLGGLIGLLFV